MRVIGAAYNFKGLEHPSGEPIFFFKNHRPDYVHIDPMSKNNRLKLPSYANSVWPEVEVAFHVGMDEENNPFILHYSVANDFTADFGPDCHYLLGKSFPGSFKISMVATSKAPRADAKMYCRINEELIQEDVVGNMIYNPQKLLDFLHSTVGLEKRDIITCGTPFHTKTPLKSGDIVSVFIEGLGGITNYCD
jgi:2-keto-4-pentenoate hydratase/2-oxohepta-3-ene-1,7-dioic acid hydratase in catechol pathway